MYINYLDQLDDPYWEKCIFSNPYDCITCGRDTIRVDRECGSRSDLSCELLCQKVPLKDSKDCCFFYSQDSMNSIHVYPSYEEYISARSNRNILGKSTAESLNLSFYSLDFPLLTANSANLSAILHKDDYCLYGYNDRSEQDYKVSVSSLLELTSTGRYSLTPVQSSFALIKSADAINSKSNPENDDDLKSIVGDHIFGLLKEINELYLSMVSLESSMESMCSNQYEWTSEIEPSNNIRERIDVLQDKIFESLKGNKEANTVSLDLSPKFEQGHSLYGILRVTNIQIAIVKYVGFEIYVINHDGVTIKVLMTKLNRVITPNFFCRFVIPVYMLQNLHSKITMGIVVECLNDNKNIVKTDFINFTVHEERDKSKILKVVENDKDCAKWTGHRFCRQNIDPIEIQ